MKKILLQQTYTLAKMRPRRLKDFMCLFFKRKFYAVSNIPPLATCFYNSAWGVNHLLPVWYRKLHRILIWTVILKIKFISNTGIDNVKKSKNRNIKPYSREYDNNWFCNIPSVNLKAGYSVWQGKSFLFIVDKNISNKT